MVLGGRLIVRGNLHRPSRLILRCDDCCLRSQSSSKSSPPHQQHQLERHHHLRDLPKIIKTRGVPIHLYADEIESQAMAQVRLLAESPIPVDYVSVMPDAHLGKGVTIGTVFASESYVCPNAVGVDIGCGMAAVPILGLRRRDLTASQKTEIFRKVKERIPTGFAQRRRMLPEVADVIEEITEEIRPTDFVRGQLHAPRVTDQLGTLGGGNHFLEVVYDDANDRLVAAAFRQPQHWKSSGASL